VKRYVRLLGLLSTVMAALFILCGCFSARIHLKVNMSGSAEMEVTMGAPKTLMSLGSTAAMFDTIKEDLENDEFTIENFADDKQVGFTAVKKVSSIEDFSSLSLGDSLMISEEPIITVTKHPLSSTYRIETDLDLENILGDKMDALTHLANIRFALTLPVSPAEHNADEVSENGKTLEWRLRTGEDNPIMVSATAPNLFLIIIIVLPALAIVAAAIFLLVRRQRRRKKSAEKG
jgi:hypothetical protein